MARRRALSSIGWAFLIWLAWLAGLGPGAAGAAVEFPGHRVVGSLEFRAVRVMFWEVFEALAELCPGGQELRIVQSREFTWVTGLLWVAGLHGLPRLVRGGGLAFLVPGWLSSDQECKTTMRRTV
jgi:hypothetical protein